MCESGRTQLAKKKKAEPGIKLGSLDPESILLSRLSAVVAALAATKQVPLKNIFSNTSTQ